MKQTGIIMRGNHPKLILDGIKTMTRRTWGLEFINLNPDAYKFLRMEGDLAVFEQIGFTMTEIKPNCPRSYPVKSTETEGGNIQFYIKCPYGQVGDRLWVRETWFDNSFYPDDRDNVLYRADGEFQEQIPEEYEGAKWAPSIHMFRWASRITLEITEVRVERLQEITKEDIKAEGLGMPSLPNSHLPYFKFKDLWDSLNAKRGYGWEVNPWVWVISFKLRK